MPSFRSLLPVLWIAAIGAVAITLQTAVMVGQRPSLSKYRQGADPVREVRQAEASDVGGHVAAADNIRRHLPSGSSETIFVSIAAFRDVEANQTLHSLFARAKDPRRVFVGLICQMDYGVTAEQCLFPDSWEGECGTREWCPTDNIRARHFDGRHSRGPTYARYLASLLYRGEDYFMMIDSHNRFVKDWDEVIVKEYKKVGRRKAVLSTYPMGIHPRDERIEEQGVAYLCALGTTGNGWTAGFPGPYWANTFHKSNFPKPQPYVGAGLVFGPGELVDDVPFDPHLPYLFFGEEFMLGIRLWTNGYDLYSPGVNILYHRYGRKGPRMETHGRKVHELQKVAHRRIQHILGITEPGSNGTKRIVPLDTEDHALTADLPKYGLGTVRSLWQYWKFARLDPINMSPSPFSNFWCTTYGPQKGPYTQEWRQHLEENAVAPEVWWQNGVAKLSVPPPTVSVSL